MDAVYQLGALFANYPVLKWLTVASGFVLLVISLYKLFSATQPVDHQKSLTTHETNESLHHGQSQSQREIHPENQSIVQRLKDRITGEVMAPCNFSKKQRNLLSGLYLAQQLLFGILLFVFGVFLCWQAIRWWTVASPGTLASLLAALCGVILIILGYLAAFYRTLGDPFTDR